MHISECEANLRQYNVIYSHLRATKGFILFEEETSQSPASISSFHISLNTSNPQIVPLQEESAERGSCMRTIPFLSMKRRMLFGSHLPLTRKKVKYSSSIQCSCKMFPTYHSPCIICNGGSNYMQSIDTEFMSYKERISLLNSSCHPFLCL